MLPISLSVHCDVLSPLAHTLFLGLPLPTAATAQWRGSSGRDGVTVILTVILGQRCLAVDRRDTLSIHAGWLTIG